MRKSKLKTFCLIFISFSIIMAFFSEQLSWTAAKLLSITGEMKLYSLPENENNSYNITKDDKNNPLAPKKIKKEGKKNTQQKKEQKIDILKQVTRDDLPKTQTPIGIIIPDNNFNDFIAQAPHFPELRLFSGENWSKEKTEVYCITNLNILYIKVLCYDSEPDMLVKIFSIAEGSNNAWKDDSVELFLMKDPLSNEYHQFIASCSGKTHRFVHKIRDDDPRMGQTISSSPADEFVKVSEFDEGYIVEFSIPLSLLKFDQNLYKEGFHMQIVRNYRGEKKELGAQSLQLFPVYIHGDNRFGECNHYWKAFGKIKFKVVQNE